MAKVVKLGSASRKLGKQLDEGEQQTYKKGIGWLVDQLEKDKASKHRRYFALGGRPIRDEEYLANVEEGIGLEEGSEEREILKQTLEEVREKSAREGLGERGTWLTGYQVGFNLFGKDYGKEGKYQLSYSIGDLANPYNWGRLVEDNVKSLGYQVLYDRIEARTYGDLRESGKNLKNQADDLSSLLSELGSEKSKAEYDLRKAEEDLRKSESQLKSKSEQAETIIAESKKDVDEIRGKRGEVTDLRQKRSELEEDLSYAEKSEQELLDREKMVLSREAALAKEKKSGLSPELFEERQRVIDAIADKTKKEASLKNELEGPEGLREQREDIKREFTELLREREAISAKRLRGESLTVEEFRRLEDLDKNILGPKGQVFNEIKKKADSKGFDLGTVRGEIESLRADLKVTRGLTVGRHPDLAAIEAELEKLSWVRDDYRKQLTDVRKSLGRLEARRRSVAGRLVPLEKEREELARKLTEARQKHSEAKQKFDQASAHVSESKAHLETIKKANGAVEKRVGQMTPRFREWLSPRTAGDTLFGGVGRKARGRLWQMQDFLSNPIGYSFRSFIWKGDPLWTGKSVLNHLGFKTDSLRGLVFPKDTLRGHLYDFYQHGPLNRTGREGLVRASNLFRAQLKSSAGRLRSLASRFKPPSGLTTRFSFKTRWYPKGLTKVGSDYLSKFGGQIKNAFVNLKQFIRPLIDLLKPLLQRLANFLATLLKEAISQMMRFFSQAMGSLLHGTVFGGGLGAAGVGSAGVAGAGGAAGGGIAAETVAETATEVAAAPETVGISLAIPVIKLAVVIVVIAILLIVLFVVFLSQKNNSALKDYNQGGAAESQLTLTKSVDVLDASGNQTGTNRIPTLSPQVHRVRYRITMDNSRGDFEVSNITLYDNQCGRTFTPPTLPRGSRAEVGTCEIEVIADTDRVVINEVTGTATIDGSQVNLQTSGLLIIGNPTDAPPSGWPISDGCISQGPGGSFSHTRTGNVYGNALDIYPRRAEGYNIRATHAGIAQAYYSTATVGDGPYPGFGYYVVVTSVNGTFSSVYAHMESISVSDGQAIVSGTLLGRMDSTVGPGGTSTADHIHYALSNLAMSAPYIPVNVPACSFDSLNCENYLNLNAGQNCFEP